MMILYDKSEIYEEGCYSVYLLSLVDSAHSILGKCGKDIQWHIPIVKSENKIGYEEFLEKAYEEAKFEISFDYEIFNRIGKMMFLLNVSPKDTLRVLEDYGSLTREQPLILGIVDYKDFFKQNQEYELDNEEIEQFFNEYSFPLTISDMETLIKNNCPVLRLHDSKLFCLSSKNVIRRFSVGELRDVIALIIPMEFYDNSYGFKGAFYENICL